MEFHFPIDLHSPNINPLKAIPRIKPSGGHTNTNKILPPYKFGFEALNPYSWKPLEK